MLRMRSLAWFLLRLFRPDSKAAVLELPTPLSQPTLTEFDAFISYSHAQDSVIATALQHELARFGVSWLGYLRSWPARASSPSTRSLGPLRVFRDETNLAASPGLWPTILKALSSSDWFILMASRKAAESVWVRHEIAWWLANRSAQRILIAWTDGDLRWQGDDFDWRNTNAIPPELAGEFPSEPRWVDLRSVRPIRAVPGPDDTSRRTFRGHISRVPGLQLGDVVAEFAAPIRRLDKDSLVGHYVKVRRRTLRTVQGVIAALAALVVALSGSTLYATIQQREAVRQQRIAIGKALTAQADALRDTQPRVSLMLSVKAMQLDPSGDARASLITTIGQTHYAGTLAGLGWRVVTFTPDGHTLASSRGDSGILWAVDDHQQPVVLARLRGNAVAVSPDGHTLATSGEDGRAMLWDIGDRSHPVRLSTLDGVATLAFGPDGRTLATGKGNGTAILWDLSDRAHPVPLTTLGGHTGDVRSVAFSPDGRTFATGSGDGTTILWDLADRSHPVPLTTLGNRTLGDLSALSDTVETIVFSPDGSTFATSSPFNAAVLWDLGDRTHPRRLSTLGLLSDPRAIAFGPGGRTLAGGSPDGPVILWDV